MAAHVGLALKVPPQSPAFLVHNRAFLPPTTCAKFWDQLASAPFVRQAWLSHFARLLRPIPTTLENHR